MHPAARRQLYELARAAVEAAVKGEPLPAVPADAPAELKQEQGVFVTLHARGRLRGCIGLIEGVQPLAEAVVAMAQAAAIGDPRFSPVTPAELPGLDLELSVLSPLRRVASADEIELGRDGVLVRRGRRSGVFLPQVAEETGWDKACFLDELCAGKACLPPRAWQDPDTELWTFTVEKITHP